MNHLVHWIPLRKQQFTDGEAILLSDRIYILNGKPGEIRDEIIIKEKKPRAEDFYLTDEFLAYKREIIAKL